MFFYTKPYSITTKLLTILFNDKTWFTYVAAWHIVLKKQYSNSNSLALARFDDHRWIGWRMQNVCVGVELSAETSVEAGYHFHFHYHSLPTLVKQTRRD